MQAVKNYAIIQLQQQHKGVYMDYREIVDAIKDGTYTNDELTEITNAIKNAKSVIAKMKAKEIKIGTRVRFTHPRKKLVERGTVIKMGIKNSVVNCSGNLYSVPANLLEVI